MLLKNIRGMKFNYELLEQQEMAQEQGSEEQEELTRKMQASSHKPKEEPKKEVIQTKKKEALTPEKLAQLKKMAPEINWEADTVAREGQVVTIDSREVAKITGKDHKHLMRDINLFIKILDPNPDLGTANFFIESFRGLSNFGQLYFFIKSTYKNLLL